MPIRKFVNKFIKSRKLKPAPQLPIVPSNTYQILTDNISQNGINFLKKMHRAKFQAYFVGGSVRDLLLKISPKDIDVATDAKPEQLYKLFRNCRLIGRRFRLAHLLYKREIIEVATFRAGETKKRTSKHLHKTDQEGMIVRDNIYGTIEEDAWRRDFTVNALYYDAIKNILIDHTGGFLDLQYKTLRIIGDPDLRYREDPVRMLRAIRFASKLDFTIETKTSAAIHTNNQLITNVSTARLFDEVIKIFHSGHAEKAFPLLKEYGLFKLLFPLSYNNIAASPKNEQILLQTFINTDKRIKENKPVTPAFLFVALLWYPVQIRANKLKSIGTPKAKALEQAAKEIISKQLATISISKRFIKTIKEIWMMQNRLVKRRGRSVFTILTHPRFRAGYDFLLLRAHTNEINHDIAQWWTTFQFAPEDEQEKMVIALQEHDTNTDTETENKT